jgi:hypothetical protein
MEGGGREVGGGGRLWGEWVSRGGLGNVGGGEREGGEVGGGRGVLSGGSQCG